MASRSAKRRLIIGRLFMGADRLAADLRQALKTPIEASHRGQIDLRAYESSLAQFSQIDIGNVSRTDANIGLAIVATLEAITMLLDSVTDEGRRICMMKLQYSIEILIDRLCEAEPDLGRHRVSLGGIMK